MLSQSERVIDVIRAAAKSVQGARQQPKVRQGYVLASGLPLATVLPRFRQVFSQRVHSGQ